MAKRMRQGLLPALGALVFCALLALAAARPAAAGAPDGGAFRPDPVAASLAQVVERVRGALDPEYAEQAAGTGRTPAEAAAAAR